MLAVESQETNSGELMGRLSVFIFLAILAMGPSGCGQIKRANISADAARQQAEKARREAEVARESALAAREQARRDAAEQQALAAEAQKKAEAALVHADQSRQQFEQAEEARRTAEQEARKQTELARAAAEQANQERRRAEDIQQKLQEMDPVLARIKNANDEWEMRAEEERKRANAAVNRANRLEAGLRSTRQNALAEKKVTEDALKHALQEQADLRTELEKLKEELSELKDEDGEGE